MDGKLKGRFGRLNPLGFSKRRGSSSRKARLWLIPIVAVLFVMSQMAFRPVARADLAGWIQEIASGSAVESAFFKPMPLPGGLVPFLLPPAQTAPALTKLIQAEPGRADLIRLRARVEEQELNFSAAEADWEKYARLDKDRSAGELALADFYHRRLMPEKEIQALEAAAHAPDTPDQNLLPPSQQRSWLAFERIFSVINAQALPAAVSISAYRAWIARYPRESSTYQQFFHFLVEQKNFTAAQNLIAEYKKAFPKDAVFPVTAQATLEYRRGSEAQALALYNRAFQPLWPKTLVDDYFKLLGQTHHLRDFLASARAAVRANPDDLNAAVRLFYYYGQQRDFSAATRPLIEFRIHKESSGSPWTARELYTLARLFENIDDYNEAARYYYALYSLQPDHSHAAEGMPNGAELGLAGLANILFTAPTYPISFGSGNLSFYHDVATMDPYPGFLNGILSLVLNSSKPAYNYAQEDQSSQAYFHRAAAARLVALFDRRFPNSPQRANLHLELMQSYTSYGASKAVVRTGKKFLADFPHSRLRTQVALMMADAYARTGQVPEEFAIYNSLLKELAAQAQGVPLGSNVENRPNGARSAEYQKVLDRYISRLLATHQPLQVLALYNREISQNPNDPGLYVKLAAFLEANHLGAEVEKTYELAIHQFKTRAWYDRLARWYLRHKRQEDLDRLTQQVVETFKGSDLDEYFSQVGSLQWISPELYLQLNLYAHKRFPHDLTFVRNLLAAYRNQHTANPAAWEQLMRRYWFYSSDLRSRFFAYLSRTGNLNSEMETLGASPVEPPTGHVQLPAGQPDRWAKLASSNPAAAEFIAEGETWESHFEQAAPIMRALATEYPAQESLNSRAASVYRSLAAFQPKDTSVAAAIEENLHHATPRSHAVLARIGDIYADHEMYARSRPYWDQIARIEPGREAGYLDAAGIYWDYYLFNDALRVINEGRRKLDEPSFAAYQEGVIYEGMRDDPRAISEYIKGALASPSGEYQGESSSQRRLIHFAQEPAYRLLVDQATARLVSGTNPPERAVRLRVAVLQAQKRRNDLRSFLASLTARTSSLDLLTSVGQLAQEYGFNSVRKSSILRRIALSHDPVERMQLRLDLVHFEESRGNITAAQQTIEQLYRAHPLVLGIVRATVDFYWQNKMPEQAVSVLAKAAQSARPDLKTSFLLEAARKSNEAGEYAAARKIMEPLLLKQPFNAAYLALVAESYARAGDDQSLRSFYLAKIKALESSILPPGERISRIAALRQALIPALTRLKLYGEALEQYIQVIDRYPEDEGLTGQAAAYAAKHELTPKLLAFYEKAEKESPRDERWPIVLAHLDTWFGNYRAAIAAYTHATAIRPDRIDLFEARAKLEERLMLFAQAVETNTTIYKLSYDDPQWMEKVAKLEARLGNTKVAVEDVRKALIENRPQRPENDFNVAQKLESWGVLREAGQFAKEGVTLAGDTLLTDPESVAGAGIYARIMTRLGQPEQAYQRLYTAWQSAQPTSQMLASGVGVASIQTFARKKAMEGFTSALKEMGDAAKRYLTPEQKVAFEKFAEQQKDTSDGTYAQTLLPLVESAGFTDLQAKWLDELMMNAGQSCGSQTMGLINLQNRRMRYEELGQELERCAAVATPQEIGGVLAQAADSYQAAGDTTSEMRVLAKLYQDGVLGGGRMTRYFTLLLKSDPNRLVTLAGSPGGPPGAPEAIANFAIASGNRALALRVIAAIGRREKPVWQRAYTALAGLYFADLGPTVDSAFRGVLGGGTVGERVAHPVNLNESLAGNAWFYYGSRYGEYLALAKKSNADDYLPAELEARPANPQAYFNLAEYFRQKGELQGALRDYEHVLELDPNRGDANDRMALVYWKQGKHPQAEAQWKAAFQAFRRQEDQQRVPATFWQDVRTTLEHVGQHGALQAVKNEATLVLQAYIKRNGSYRVEPLLRGVMEASSSSQAGIEWLVELSRDSNNPLGFIRQFINADWIPKAQRGILYQHVITLVQAKMQKAYGAQRKLAESELNDWRIRWISYLLDMRQTKQARTVMDALPQKVRKTQAQQVVPLQIRIAAQQNTLDALLASYQHSPTQIPSMSALQTAAGQLQEAGDKENARKVLAFVYTREINNHNYDPANFLGLAQIRLETGDTAQALGLLHRMTLVAGQPFAELEPAASLLEKYSHPAEASQFLGQLVKAEPWNSEARRRMAEDQLQANVEHQPALKMLASVAADTEAPYDTRVQAADSLGKAHATIPGSGLGSAELELLASDSVATAAAVKPFFYPARVEAARQEISEATKIRLLLQAIAIRPGANAARLALFTAAAKSARYELAVNALKPLAENRTNPCCSYMAPSYARGEAVKDWRARTFLTREGLTQAERSRLANELANACLHLNDLRSAQNYFEIAIALEPAGAKRAAIQKSLEAVRARIKLEAENARRRPRVSTGFAQPNVVRPRLTMASAEKTSEMSAQMANGGGER